MTGKTTPELFEAMPAMPASVPVLRKAARSFADQAGLDAEQISGIALAVTEAVTNAVVHAYAGREPGTVTLVGRAEDERLVFEVLDDGCGLTPRIDSPGLGLGLPLLGRLCAHFDIGSGHGDDRPGTRVMLVFDAPGLRGDDAALRARLEQVLGTIGDAITVSDATGRLVYANRVAAELLGVEDPEEVADGVSAELAARFSITLPDGRPVALEDLPDQRLLAGERDLEPLLTRSVHLASGRSRWLLTSSYALADDLAFGRRLAVSVTRDVTVATESERRQRFLADAGEALASPLEIDETFQRIADLAVPELADWCAVDVLESDGVRLRRVALAHRDPEKTKLGWEIHRRFPPDPETDAGAYAVVRSQDPLFLPDLPDELLESGVPDPEHLAMLRAIGMRSVVVVPMVARGHAVGVLTLVTSDSARAFAEGDVDFALAVARRAALAVDTARRLAGR